MDCLQSPYALVDIPLFTVYIAFSLLSVQGILFTEFVLYSEFNISSTVNDTKIINEIQTLTADWTTIFLVCQALPAIFVTLYVSTRSDRVGRKITMVVSTSGYLVTAVNYLFVYLYALPIEYLLIGNLAIGFTGTTFLFRSGASSYVSDLLSNDRLTFRMSVLLGVTILSVGCGQIVFSTWIEAKGFLQPFVFTISALTFTNFYIIFLMQESLDKTNRQQNVLFKDILSDMVNVVVSNKHNRRTIVLLLLLSRVSYSTLINGIFHALQLYCIGPPLYMSTSSTGYFTACYSVSNAFGMLFITKALQRYCNISDYALFYLGSLSAMASSLVIAAATSDTVIYLSVPLAVLAILPKAIVEAQLSKLVEKNEKGAIFAQAGVLDNLGFLLGPIWIGVTYSATVETIPGLIFYIMFAGALVNMLLVIYIQYKFGSIEEALAKSFKSDEEYICGSEETHLLQTSSIMKY
ncbi:proton-coupled folate transporter-like isoform X1 [Anneissia japonica]|uniref:proton-coupled folate transporter-like isoform X1 n=1 Tax=Anneissia japonica TaxID=1529436 RepID=UPI00142555B1|nr:proton-coupled folate transporter-like isoform X1 [Anneissia japonica]